MPERAPPRSMRSARPAHDARGPLPRALPPVRLAKACQDAAARWPGLRLRPSPLPPGRPPHPRQNPPPQAARWSARCARSKAGGSFGGRALRAWPAPRPRVSAACAGGSPAPPPAWRPLRGRNGQRLQRRRFRGSVLPTPATAPRGGAVPPGLGPSARPGHPRKGRAEALYTLTARAGGPLGTSWRSPPLSSPPFALRATGRLGGGSACDMCPRWARPPCGLPRCVPLLGGGGKSPGPPPGGALPPTPPGGCRLRRVVRAIGESGPPAQIGRASSADASRSGAHAAPASARNGSSKQNMRTNVCIMG